MMRSQTPHPVSMIGAKIAVPMTGINSPLMAMKTNDWPMTTCNHIEINKHVCKYLTALVGETVEPTSIMTIDMKDLAASDALFVGPHCQPWTRGGKGLGWKDERSKTILKSIDTAKHLDQSGLLKVVILENTEAILESRNGAAAGIVKVQQHWKKQLPKWLPLDPKVLTGFMVNAKINQTPAVLISVPKQFKDIVDEGRGDLLPFKLEPHVGQTASKEFTDYLDADLTTLYKKDVQGKQSKEYFKKWQAKFRQICKRGHLEFRAAVVDSQRDPDGTYDSNFFFDCLPSPTTQNLKLLVFENPRYGNNLVPPSGRYISNRERARVMGFDVKGAIDLMESLLSQRQMAVALGNSIIVGISEMVLHSSFTYIDKVFCKVNAQPIARPLTDHTQVKMPSKRAASRQIAENTPNNSKKVRKRPATSS